MYRTVEIKKKDLIQIYRYQKISSECSNLDTDEILLEKQFGLVLLVFLVSVNLHSGAVYLKYITHLYMNLE